MVGESGGGLTPTFLSPENPLQLLPSFQNSQRRMAAPLSLPVDVSAVTLNHFLLTTPVDSLPVIDWDSAARAFLQDSGGEWKEGL